MAKFLDTYIMQDSDVCLRELRPDRFEVSKWVGDLETGGWVDQKNMTLSEVNKQVRSSCQWMGRHNAWDYYRPTGKR
jgi:hypothetical protein